MFLITHILYHIFGKNQEAKFVEYIQHGAVCIVQNVQTSMFFGFAPGIDNASEEA